MEPVNREAEFKAENSRDGLRVIVNRDFYLVKFEHEHEMLMTLNEAEKLAMFILNIRKTGASTYAK